jgi:hypothetical protein
MSILTIGVLLWNSVRLSILGSLTQMMMILRKEYSVSFKILLLLDHQDMKRSIFKNSKGLSLLPLIWLTVYFHSLRYIN